MCGRVRQALLWRSAPCKRKLPPVGDYAPAHSPHSSPTQDSSQPMNAWLAQKYKRLASLPNGGICSVGQFMLQKVQWSQTGARVQLRSHPCFSPSPALTYSCSLFPSWEHSPSKSRAPDSPPGLCFRALNPKYPSPSKYSLQILSVDLLVVIVIKFPRHKTWGL